MRGMLTIALIVVGIGLVWKSVSSVSPALATQKTTANAIIAEVK